MPKAKYIHLAIFKTLISFEEATGVSSFQYSMKISLQINHSTSFVVF